MYKKWMRGCLCDSPLENKCMFSKRWITYRSYTSPFYEIILLHGVNILRICHVDLRAFHSQMCFRVRAFYSKVHQEWSWHTQMDYQENLSEKDRYWLNIIQECRSSGKSDYQWLQENNIAAPTFYYHVKQLRKKACEIPSRNGSCKNEVQEVVPLLIEDDESAVFWQGWFLSSV